MKLAGYIKMWATPAKLKVVGHRLKSELSSLSDKELIDVRDVLVILLGMVDDERQERRMANGVSSITRVP